MTGRRRDDDRTVYSSERGWVAPKKQKPTGAHSPRPPSGLPNDGVARVRRETAGRHGKTVTAVHGLRLAEGALRDLASELKPAERIGADPIDRSPAQFLLATGTGFNQLKFEARTAGV